MDALSNYFNSNQKHQYLIINLLIIYNKTEELDAITPLIVSNPDIIKQLPKSLIKKINLSNFGKKEEPIFSFSDSNQIKNKLNYGAQLQTSQHSYQWILSEVNTISQMERTESQAFKRFERLQNILKIPFGEYQDNLSKITLSCPTSIRQNFFELNKALEKELYGQNNAKDTIFQTIGQMISNPNESPKPLLFVGPPGTGKTSLAKVQKYLNVELGQ